MKYIYKITFLVSCSLTNYNNQLHEALTELIEKINNKTEEAIQFLNTHNIQLLNSPEVPSTLERTLQGIEKILKTALGANIIHLERRYSELMSYTNPNLDRSYDSINEKSSIGSSSRPSSMYASGLNFAQGMQDIIRIKNNRVTIDPRFYEMRKNAQHIALLTLINIYKFKYPFINTSLDALSLEDKNIHFFKYNFQMFMNRSIVLLTFLQIAINQNNHQMPNVHEAFFRLQNYPYCLPKIESIFNFEKDEQLIYELQRFKHIYDQENANLSLTPPEESSEIYEQKAQKSEAKIKEWINTTIPPKIIYKNRKRIREQKVLN